MCTVQKCVFFGIVHFFMILLGFADFIKILLKRWFKCNSTLDFGGLWSKWYRANHDVTYWHIWNSLAILLYFFIVKLAKFSNCGELQIKNAFIWFVLFRQSISQRGMVSVQRWVRKMRNRILLIGFIHVRKSMWHLRKKSKPH